MSFLKKLFGDYSTKEIKRVKPLVQKVLSYEEDYAKLTDAELKASCSFNIAISLFVPNNPITISPLIDFC